MTTATADPVTYQSAVLSAWKEAEAANEAARQAKQQWEQARYRREQNDDEIRTLNRRWLEKYPLFPDDPGDDQADDFERTVRSLARKRPKLQQEEDRLHEAHLKAKKLAEEADWKWQKATEGSYEPRNGHTDNGNNERIKAECERLKANAQARMSAPQTSAPVEETPADKPSPIVQAARSHYRDNGIGLALGSYLTGKDVSALGKAGIQTVGQLADCYSDGSMPCVVLPLKLKQRAWEGLGEYMQTLGLKLADLAAKPTPAYPRGTWRGCPVSVVPGPLSGNALKKADITTWGELSDYLASGKDLAELPGVSRKAAQILDVIDEKWATTAEGLAGEPPPWRKEGVDG